MDHDEKLLEEMMVVAEKNRSDGNVSYDTAIQHAQTCLLKFYRWINPDYAVVPISGGMSTDELILNRNNDAFSRWTRITKYLIGPATFYMFFKLHGDAIRKYLGLVMQINYVRYGTMAKTTVTSFINTFAPQLVRFIELYLLIEFIKTLRAKQ